MTLLEVDGLSVAFGHRRIEAVRDVSFTVEAGQRVGLIGESGCGKTVTALALMGLLPGNARVSGSVTVDGRELVGLDEKASSRMRGGQVGMVFQEPMTALDPTMRAGRQVVEALRLHDRAGSARDARGRVEDMLRAVGLDDPARIARSYPHQLSGGQRQRVCLAMALVNRPSLLICDEPTTALDVSVQARVLAVLDEILDAEGAACLFISHDLAVVSQLCSSVMVMLDGQIVESGATSDIFARPRHPYTRGLVATARIGQAEPGSRLPTVRDFYDDARDDRGRP